MMPNHDKELSDLHDSLVEAGAWPDHWSVQHGLLKYFTGAVYKDPFDLYILRGVAEDWIRARGWRRSFTTGGEGWQKWVRLDTYDDDRECQDTQLFGCCKTIPEAIRIQIKG